MEGVHGTVLRRIYRVLLDIVREREVRRSGTLSREAFVEIDRSLLVCACEGVARIQVPQDDGFAVLGLDVRRNSFVDLAIRRATMRSVEYLQGNAY